MRLSINSTCVGGLSIIVSFLNILVSHSRGERMRQIFLQSSIVKHKKPKESEESFADELQLLTHKVISKRPAFREGFDTTLEQWYANQLYNHNNSSITKTVLLQMPMVNSLSFTMNWLKF